MNDTTDRTVPDTPPDTPKVIPFRPRQADPFGLPEPATEQERKIIDILRKTSAELSRYEAENRRLETEVGRMSEQVRLMAAKVREAAPDRAALESRVRELERQLRTAPDLQTETEELLRQSAGLRRALALVDPGTWKPNDTQFSLVMGSLAQTHEAILGFIEATGGQLP